MANVNGTMKVSINIDKNEAFLALVTECGLKPQLLDKDIDGYWKLEEDNGKNVIAYYSSPSYSNSSYRSQTATITDPNMVRTYELLLELKKLQNIF